MSTEPDRVTVPLADLLAILRHMETYDPDGRPEILNALDRLGDITLVARMNWKKDHGTCQHVVTNYVEYMRTGVPHCCRTCGEALDSCGKPMTKPNETVGELVERLGEQQAYNHIVAASIGLRIALSNIIELHPDRNGYCNTCGGNWPCLTHRTASEALTGGRTDG